MLHPFPGKVVKIVVPYCTVCFTTACLTAIYHDSMFYSLSSVLIDVQGAVRSFNQTKGRK
jgi:hypothetical protein